MAGWDLVADNSGNLSVVPDPPPPGLNKLPAIGGPYPTQAEAQAALVSEQKNVANQKNADPTNPFAGKDLIPGVPNPLNPIAAPLTGITAIGDFFQRLTQANTWIRIGEVVIGILLIAVGISKISGAVNIAKVAAL